VSAFESRRRLLDVRHVDTSVTLFGTSWKAPIFLGLDLSRTNTPSPETLNWDRLARFRELWPQPLLLKGSVAREDAALAVRHGIDGVIVSNHGGRAEESGRSALESLPEVVAGAAGRVPVLVDSGAAAIVDRRAP
jgi:isopentenyl diphosphate isomerase/L-lactate dehydrogenase-like FMN-dependent dehydrogenase